MKIKSILLWTVCLVASYSCNSGNETQKKEEPLKVAFEQNDVKKTIDVLVDGELFTTFRWHDDLTKPVLLPIRTARGTEVTRGFPVFPKTGERADHPHQIGNWLTYGNVNGSDFWGNGSKGLGSLNRNGGSILLESIDEMSGGDREGKLVTTASWNDSLGNRLLTENTTYFFLCKDSIRIIDRIVVLTAGEIAVSMPDTKEGMFGIRVARELELPDQGEGILYSADGKPERVKEMDNAAISGDYLSSTGQTGMDVWGSRAGWMSLWGNIRGENISVVICDHPENPGYPTWWHARGYGLFAANPLGARDFTKGEEEDDFNIPAGESITFRYRIVISSGKHLNTEEIENYSRSFADF